MKGISLSYGMDGCDVHVSEWPDGSWRWTVNVNGSGTPLEGSAVTLKAAVQHAQEKIATHYRVQLEAAGRFLQELSRS